MCRKTKPFAETKAWLSLNNMNYYSSIPFCNYQFTLAIK